MQLNYIKIETICSFYFLLNYIMANNTDNIEDYTIEILNLSHKEMTVLPDLSLYKNIKILNCSFNKLINLDNLPSGLIE